MTESANVKSTQAIRDFKVAMVNFGEDARSALSSTDMEVRRIRNWLARDQLTYWQSQIKRCNEQLSIARTELHRRRLSQQGSDAVSDTEQKEAVRLAQRKLAEAEEKLAKVKKWIPILEHAISEYNSTSQPLGDRLTGTMMNSLALLERIANTIDSYASIAPTSTEFSVGSMVPGGPATAGASAPKAGNASDSQGDAGAPAEAAATAEGEAAPAAETAVGPEAAAEAEDAVPTEANRGSRT